MGSQGRVIGLETLNLNTEQNEISAIDRNNHVPSCLQWLNIISGNDWKERTDERVWKDWEDLEEPKLKMDNDPMWKNLIKSKDIDSELEFHYKDAKYGGGLPPVTQNLTSDLGGGCSCGKVLLSSLGPAANFQPQAMGTYKMSYTSYNNHPSYRQNYGSDYRLYFGQTGWLIGDNRGAPTGYIHNSDRSQACPYTIPGGWMFYSAQHGAWYPDTSLVLRCVTP